MKVHAKKVSANMLQVEVMDLEEFEKIKIGTTVSTEVKRVRNYQFLRKYFAMLQMAFDYWEPSEHASANSWKDEPIRKNFDKFRNDVQVVAGFGIPVWNLRGELRVESKSISFGKMDAEEFDKVYNAVLDVLMDRVLQSKGFTKEAVNELVDQLIAFT